MPDDLPELVDANSSDTSRNSDDDYEGPPDLVEMEEASSDSLHFDSEVRIVTFLSLNGCLLPNKYIVLIRGNLI